MLKATRYLPLLLAGFVTAATPACAGVIYTQHYPAGDRDDRAFYNRGFQEGRDLGAEDARRGRSYDLNRHREYRNNRRGDDRGDLRAYRDGFAAGYDEGYRRFARDSRDDRRGFPPPPAPPEQTPAPASASGLDFSSPANNEFLPKLDN